MHQKRLDRVMLSGSEASLLTCSTPGCWAGARH